MGERVFEGPAGPAMGPRLFGGQAIAQALMAGCAAEDGGRLPNSLHAHFLKAGASTDRVRYTVTTLSQGRSFAVRRIDGMQGDTLIFSMTASFHIHMRPHPRSIWTSMPRYRRWKTGGRKVRGRTTRRWWIACRSAR